MAAFAARTTRRRKNGGPTRTYGKIVYYRNPSVSWYVDMNAMHGSSFAAMRAAAEMEQAAHAIEPRLANKISAEIETGLETIRLQLAMKNGRPVIAYAPLNRPGTYYLIRVAGGVAAAENIVR